MSGGMVRDSDGRWRVLARDGSRPYFYRAVMEAHLGRPLVEGEQVHHINGDPADDRIENLEVLSIQEHGRYHGIEAWRMRKAQWQHEWAEHHERCVECSTTKRPHQGNGRCSRCAARHRARAYRARKAAA